MVSEGEPRELFSGYSITGTILSEFIELFPVWKCCMHVCQIKPQTSRAWGKGLAVLDPSAPAPTHRLSTSSSSLWCPPPPPPSCLSSSFHYPKPEPSLSHRAMGWIGNQPPCPIGQKRKQRVREVLQAPLTSPYKSHCNNLQWESDIVQIRLQALLLLNPVSSE